jgi:branched-chain amino acid transport system permease protein
MSLLQSVVNGVALGALYALVAVGIALIFGVLRMVNFAHSEMITGAAYALVLTSAWPLPLSVVACLLTGVVLAVTIDRVGLRPLRTATPVTTLIVTFAVAFALQAVWLMAFGPEGRSADVLGALNKPLVSGELVIRWVTIVELVASGLMLGGLAVLLNRTDIGLQMRAAAKDFDAARLLGVRANRVIVVAFVLAGLSAAVVALLLTAARPLVSPTFGLQITILGLVGVVVGGMDRLGAATAGGFAVGFLTAFVGGLLSSESRVFLPSVVFGLVILVLLLRPGGLFLGRQTAPVERV